jgi:hypothetical protein
MATKVVEEKLRWLQTFMVLYEKASPVIRHITNLEKLRAGELPVGPTTLVVSNLTLRPVLSALEKIHKRKEKELVAIQKEFRLALVNCLKASELAEKYIECDGHSIDRQLLLSMVINEIVLAQEYIESVSKKLAPYLREHTLLDPGD